MNTLSVIGAGKLGKTLARLFHTTETAKLLAVCNKRTESTQQAVAFIGAGQAVEDASLIPQSRYLMVAVSDDAVAETARQLATLPWLNSETIVFHCSGTLPSTELAPLKERGCLVASVHPVHSFAHPEQSVNHFAGTWCCVEGDTAAVTPLTELFTRIGGTVFTVATEKKSLYHAAAVIACNYLIALENIAIETFAEAGVPQGTAMQILKPIVEGTVKNLFSSDPASALTGPVARGDIQTIQKHLTALDNWRTDYADLYRKLGEATVPISRTQGNADPAALDHILRLCRKEQNE